MAKDSAKIEYISGGQPSSYELAFGVELGPNSHSKMVSEPRSIQRVTHHIIHTPSPKVLYLRRCIRKNSSLTSVRNMIKIEYIIGRQFSHHELAFDVELDLTRSEKYKYIKM